MKKLIAAALLALAATPAAAQGELFVKEVLIPADRLGSRLSYPGDPASLEAALDAGVMAASNRQRALAGLPALGFDAALALAAARYSRRMRDEGFFDHVAPDGEGLDRRLPGEAAWRLERLGENLWTARGAIDWSVERLSDEVAANWIESPSHRDNLLEPAYTLGGVGAAVSPEGVWVTMLYGTPHADPGLALALRDHGEAPADLGGFARRMGDVVHGRLSALRGGRLGRDASLDEAARAEAQRMLAGAGGGAGTLRSALAASPGRLRRAALTSWRATGLPWQAERIAARALETWQGDPSTAPDIGDVAYDLAGVGVASDGQGVAVAVILGASTAPLGY